MKSTTLIPIEKVKANRFQPRLQFDEVALLELSESIKQNGLIQPIVVRECEDHYEIIAGERRFRACVLAGYKEVLCLILDKNDQEVSQMALVENIQRENLTAIEEAKAYVRIMKVSGLTQEQLAKKLGKSQSTIANRIRLLNLPKEIQIEVNNRTITERHARALLSVDESLQLDTLKRIVDKNLNVRQTEEYIKGLKEKDNKPKKVVMTKGFTRNIQIAINSVNQCVDMIRKLGVVITSEMEEDSEEVKIIIKLPR